MRSARATSICGDTCHGLNSPWVLLYSGDSQRVLFDKPTRVLVLDSSESTDVANHNLCAEDVSRARILRHPSRTFGLYVVRAVHTVSAASPLRAGWGSSERDNLIVPLLNATGIFSSPPLTVSLGQKFLQEGDHAG